MFDKLKRIFVVSDEDFKKQVQGNSADVAPPNVISDEQSTLEKKEVQLESNIDLNIETEEGQVDEKFINVLLGAIEKKNQTGFDYLEYKQSLQNLEDIAMDESTRYNSAMAMAKTMGSDPQKIMNSANFYLNVLKTEQEKFSKALISKQDKIDKTQKDTILSKQNALKEKKEQIKRLQQEITTLENQIEKAKTSINTNKAKLQSTEGKFNRAFNMIVSQIQKDIQKINQFVK